MLQGRSYRFVSQLFLSNLARQLDVSRHYSRAVELHSWDVAPKVDAESREDRTGIGGWDPVRNSRGELDPWLSPWFSRELTREEWPWVCGKGGKPALVISTLEPLQS